MDPHEFLETEIAHRQQMDKLKRIQEAAYKWEAGELPADRVAEIVFGLVNQECVR